MSKDLEQKKAQKIELLGGNLILRGEIEEGKIMLAEESKKDARRIKELKVFLIGPEVTTVKEGEEVRVSSDFMMLASQSKQINPFKYNGSDYKKDNEFYILAEESDIVGKF